MQSLVRDPLQGFEVLHVYPATLKLHGPYLLQQGKGLGDGLALGADHGCHLSMGVAGGYLVAVSRHHPSLSMSWRRKLARRVGTSLSAMSSMRSSARKRRSLRTLINFRPTWAFPITARSGPCRSIWRT